MKKKRDYWIAPMLLLVLFVAILIASAIGVVYVPIADVVKIILFKIGDLSTIDIPQYLILTVWKLRLPRIIMSLLVGMSLAISGAVFQSVFRNPICDPYILGISSGASLGAVIAFVLGWDVFLFGITIPALITALLSLFFIIGIAQFNKNRGNNTLLLAGIALNFLMSAVVTILIVLNQQEMSKIIFWTMGSFTSSSWLEILFLLSIMFISIFSLFYYEKDLNIMQLGNDAAKSLGVNTKKVTLMTLLFSSLLIATVVSMCGVIGFIGLIIPHIVRLLFGNQNRKIFFYSIIFGAFFLLIADTVARTIALPSELPVGSITAIAGAPFFVYLIYRRKNNNY
ncbi:MAG: iron ABC transporter permease [Bacteroidales bacterium]|jgi:iron complex transport system permease protein|nr:iron ABC transporter permease [Bacteroidales bacterium]